MKVWGVSAEQLRSIVDCVSVCQYGGNIVFKREPETVGRAVAFTLTVRNSRESGGRRSGSGRRVAACCWHGHRDIMRAIFQYFPEARLKTSQADYRGREDFEFSFESTGYTNIGSMVDPLSYQDACDCEVQHV